jgi:DMSO/TMAO reductase YedYZ molybdopterin-dependent catalytic subunit
VFSNLLYDYRLHPDNINLLPIQQKRRDLPGGRGIKELRVHLRADPYMARFTTVSLIITLCIIIVAALYLSTIIGLPVLTEKNITPLTSVEVREYQGERLSSIADFRENSIHGPQYIEQDSYRLNVSGLVGNSIDLSYNEAVKNFPHYTKKVTLFCVEGWEVTILWEGLLVSDILEDAGVLPGANTVIFYAADGYSTSLPLDYIKERDIIMAYRMNGVELPAERGFPFQLVAEDRWGYKWIKWITRIEVSSDPSYKGYWESRGYSQIGDLNKSYFF